MSFHLRRPLAAPLSESNHSTGRDLSRAGLPAALIALAIALVSLFGVGLAQPDLPGLQYDEAADAVIAMEMILGQPPSTLKTITVFGRELPLMKQQHIGPTAIYIDYVGLSLFGISVEAVRLTYLLVGALALVLLWGLARLWFDDLTAFFVALLCGTAPVFIWWGRTGAIWASQLLPISLAMLLALWRWWQTGRTTWLLCGVFLFSFGVMSKILFLWLAAPLGLMGMVLLLHARTRAFILQTIRRVWFAALIVMALGLLPLIVHNVPNGDTIQFVLGNASQTRMYGHNNLAVLDNLALITSEFLRAIGGDTVYFQAPAVFPVSALAFVVSAIYVVARSVTERRLIFAATSNATAREARLRLFLLLCVVAVLPLSTVSITKIGVMYLFFVMPFAWLLMAVAMRDGVRWVSGLIGPQRAVAVGVVAFALLVSSHLISNVQHLQHFNATGGRGVWSDAIFTLARVLEERYADRQIYALDWGFSRSVSFLTKNRVRVQEIYEFQPAPSSAFTDMARVTLQEADSLYLVHPPGQAAFPRYRDVFERQAQILHKRLHVELALTERDGTPYAQIIRATEMPRAFNISPTLATRNALFDDALKLLGGEVSYDAGAREVAVRLHWQSLSDTLPDDTVLVHVVNQNTGEVLHVADQQPFEGHYPFSRWMKGEVVTEPRWVTLPAGLPPGVYQIRIGVYNTHTGARRRIHDPLNDAAGDSLMLDTFEIP